MVIYGFLILRSLLRSIVPETLKTIIEALREEEDYNIVCSTTTILDPEELGPNTDRFYACRFLPAHLVNEMADIAVLHGGQGTIQTAAWAGTPVVGIGFQAEQQANIDGIARAGMAIRIPIYSVSHIKILNTIKKINQEKYKRNALLMKEKVRAVDGVKKTVEIMNNFLLN